MSNNSRRIKSYKESKYTVSVRHNLENDRIDEGDYSENEFNENQWSNSKLENKNK